MEYKSNNVIWGPENGWKGGHPHFQTTLKKYGVTLGFGRVFLNDRKHQSWMG